jgi:hypothetical protein
LRIVFELLSNAIDLVFVIAPQMIVVSLSARDQTSSRNSWVRMCKVSSDRGERLEMPELKEYLESP